MKCSLLIAGLLAALAVAAPALPSKAGNSYPPLSKILTRDLLWLVERRDGDTEFDPDYGFKAKRDGNTEFDPDYGFKHKRDGDTEFDPDYGFKK